MNSGLRSISYNESAKTLRTQRSFSNTSTSLVSYTEKDFQTIAQILTLAQSLHNKCDTHGSHYNLNLTGATSMIMSNANQVLSTSTVGATRNYEIKPSPKSVEKFKDMSLSEVLTAYRRVLKINDEKSDEAHLYKLVLKMSMKKNKKGGAYQSWTQIFAQMRARYKNKYKAYQWRQNKLKLNVINGLTFLAYKSYQPAPTRCKSFKQFNDQNEAPQLLKTNRVQEVRKILKEVSLNPQRHGKIYMEDKKPQNQEG